MRRLKPIVRSNFLVLLPACAVAAFAADNGQNVHRCVGQHGEIVFSGLPCTAAEPAVAPPSAEAPAPAVDTACPASREALRERISAAIARRDANTLAALLHWRGVGARAAGERLRALRELAARPLLAIDAGGGDAATDDARASDSLRIRTGSNESGGVREHTFGVDAEGGCYWLDW